MLNAAKDMTDTLLCSVYVLQESDRDDVSASHCFLYLLLLKEDIKSSELLAL